MPECKPGLEGFFPIRPYGAGLGHAGFKVGKGKRIDPKIPFRRGDYFQQGEEGVKRLVFKKIFFSGPPFFSNFIGEPAVFKIKKHSHSFNPVNPHQHTMKRGARIYFPAMKQSVLLLLILPLAFMGSAQGGKIKEKKYPSLFWEISGNGLKKSSYLFGTMHVSNKLAFHLSDSFYLAIRKADVVALETNPESWQEDMMKYEGGFGYNNYNRWNRDGFRGAPGDYLNEYSLRFGKYEAQIEAALSRQSGIINNLLYRSYSDNESDFQEDTFLDMYIFQSGKKLGKKVAGVENYGESMKLMMEAYKDMYKEKNRKERSFEYNEDFSPGKLQEAYRTGNLDLLDTINKLNSQSAAFDEKFLYKRNEIQAKNIDSIIRSGSVLFVGVGAAHLPGHRGVIEMLRSKGYKLRPIMMAGRDSRQKDMIDKIRVPVSFKTQISADGFYKVDIPGKFYDYDARGSYGGNIQQYADMSNGSYYSVYRIITGSGVLGHSTDDVYRRVDSLLYENVPGKILSRKDIARNGYRGIDIVNRTRRGDHQRYHIFITPFEILVFKMSGNGAYVSNGEEADKFFASIQLKELKNGSWKEWQPAYGGFSVSLPTEAFETIGYEKQYEAFDKEKNVHYLVNRLDIHNHSFLEEDTFDLSLLEESFAGNEFIARQLDRHQTRHKGYPALDCRFKQKDSSFISARFLIQGPHYYTLLATGKKEVSFDNPFFTSFTIKPWQYREIKEEKDTSLYFSVKTPVFPQAEEGVTELPSPYNLRLPYGADDEETEEDLLESGTDRSTIIENDTTGEKVYVSFSKPHRYYYADTTGVAGQWFNKAASADTVGNWIVRDKRLYEDKDKRRVREYLYSDTGSSRLLQVKHISKDGLRFRLAALRDTLTPASSFIKNFFETFNPADTLKGVNIYTKKTDLFFSDFFSADSVTRKRAIGSITRVGFDSADLPQLKNAMASLTWKEKKYLELKVDFINELGGIEQKSCSDYLKQLYYAAGDTAELQTAALENLLRQRTAYAYALFKDIVTTDPPVLNTSGSRSGSDIYDYREILRRYSSGNYYSYSDGNFMDELKDTLALTKTILPGLLPLLNLDDYKWPLMNLLGDMVDSSLVTTGDYEMYFSKFLIEAKQELKKQALNEKSKQIEEAIKKRKEEEGNTPPDYESYRDKKDEGNEDLSLYARLLLPFYESNAAVPPVFRQMLASSDKRLKYNTALMMLRKNKPVPDSLFTTFAADEEYRYELYVDLKAMKRMDKFPPRYNNHTDLGRSKLLYGENSRPDSLVQLSRMKLNYARREGYIYFYKYKMKKEDVSWKLAYTGLVPADSTQFEFEDSAGFRRRVTMHPTDWSIVHFYEPGGSPDPDFTKMTDITITDEVPLSQLLNKELKKIRFSERRSGEHFFNDGDERRDRLRNYFEFDD